MGQRKVLRKLECRNRAKIGLVIELKTDEGRELGAIDERSRRGEKIRGLLGTFTASNTLEVVERLVLFVRVLSRVEQQDAGHGRKIGGKTTEAFLAAIELDI